MRAPMRVAAPMAATTVTGTAMANAHGAAATRTTRARSIHSAGSPRSEPTTATTAARTMIAGHERAGDPVGEALAGALALLGFLDDVDDPGQGVVVGGGGDLDLEDAAAVDGGGEDVVAGSGLDGHGLAGDGGQVERGAAGADDAVGGDPFAGADDHHVADRAGRRSDARPRRRHGGR